MQKRIQRQRQAVLTIFASLLMLLALPLFLAPTSAAEETIYERRTYEEQRHTVDVAPAPVVPRRAGAMPGCLTSTATGSPGARRSGTPAGGRQSSTPSTWPCATGRR